MDLSIFLAKLFGIYLVVACFAGLVNRRKFDQLIESFSNNIALNLISGAIFMILGLAIILNHNIWQKDWRIFITLLGWITILKASIRLFAPDKLGKLSGKAIKLWPFVCFIFLMLGIYLIYVGFYTATTTQ